KKHTGDLYAIIKIVMPPKPDEKTAALWQQLADAQSSFDPRQQLGACLFGLMATNVGVGGLVPKFLYDYFPLEVRGLGTGLIYNL
ncbi:hypothetical protein MJO10_30910, partial [Salmonella enterica subsp. enterica serovar Anatum]|nr:hypothetical protein [Salmonella enterica subsp. enterica serovar Anatum]